MGRFFDRDNDDVWDVLERHEDTLNRLDTTLEEAVSDIQNISDDFDAYKAKVDQALQDLKASGVDPAAVAALEAKIGSAATEVAAQDPGAPKPPVPAPSPAPAPAPSPAPVDPNAPPPVVDPNPPAPPSVP